MSNGTPSCSNANTQVTYDIDGRGTGTSTTGTIYGIYDMSGGSTEYMMGVMKDNLSNNAMSGQSDIYNSGFTGKIYSSGDFKNFSGRNWPDFKYYDLYEFGTTNNDNAAYVRYKIGDSMTETKEWYADNATFVDAEASFFIRGGTHNSLEAAGIFYFNRAAGLARVEFTFRPVLVEQ